MLHSLLAVTMVTSLVTSQFNQAWSQSRDIEVNISSLASYIEFIMNDTLGVGRMQKEVDKLHFNRTKRNGLEFVDQLATKTSRSMEIYVKIVGKLKDALEASFESNQPQTWTPCCEYPEDRLKLTENFDSKVDLLNMCEIIAPTAPPNLQSVSISVLETMKNNREDFPNLKWQYVATQRGVLSAYPALRTPSCSFIDPRFRPWYIDTSRTRRINILILLDASRSMNDQYNSIPLINIAKNAINIILKTLTPDDKVGVIAFNNAAYRPDGCFQNTLAFATEANIDRLKSTFINTLKPEGESVYSVGFRNAFELMQSTISQDNNTDEDWSIFFITDGAPKETYQNINVVYRTIREGNAMTGNKVSISSFGIGRNANFSILRKISAQNFNNVTIASSINTVTVSPPKGGAYLIDDERMLRNVITNSLILQYNDGSSPKPIFSVPYVDSGGLGLIFTVGLPVLQADNSLFGVAAVDIKIEDIFKDALRFDNGDNSYVFVIDGDGYVYIHPLMPQPAAHGDSPEFVQINQLEPNKEFIPVMNSMMAGERGNKTFQKQEVFPIRDVVQTIMVNATYYWRAIEGVNFSICYVTQSASQQTTLPPQNIIPLVNEDSKFRYHRLDFETDSTDFCRYFYHKSTITQTLVLFAPRSFVNSFLYPRRVTPSMSREFANFFNQLLSAKSPQQINSIRNEFSTIAAYFADGVISDVMWTSLVFSLWKNTSNDYAGLRYIGTNRGVDRFYPGSVIPTGFDVTTRIWYELAVANPGLSVMSPPYVDIAGAGNVVSISKTITIPPSKPQSQETPLHEFGVMGVDFSLDHLFLKVQNLYPNCWNSNSDISWNCILVDNRGNVILHKDFISNKKESLPVKHIASDHNLMQILIDMNYVTRKRCLDFREKVYRIWYQLDPTASINASHSESNYPCSIYFMVPLPGTNVFFIARKEKFYCIDMNCNSSDSLCQTNGGTSISVNGEKWGCPCVEPTDFNACENNMSLVDGVPPCFPEHSPLKKTSECIAENLPQCFDPHCKDTNTQANCSSLVGCTWCDKTNQGDQLALPYCASSELCYNSFQGNHLPGYNASNVCVGTEPASNTILIVLALVGAVMFIIACIAAIYLIMLYKKRTLLKKTELEGDENNSNVESVQDYTMSPSNGNISIPSSPRGGVNGNRSPKKPGPRVIISVFDTDGSEILRKRVKLVHGGKTYGTLANSQHLNYKPMRKPRANTTPLLPRLSTAECSSSSNNESSILSDDNRPRSTSAGNGNLTVLAAPKPRHRTESSSDHSPSPNHSQLQQNNFSRDTFARRPWKSRDNINQLGPTNRPHSGYMPMKSISTFDLAKDATLLKSSPSMQRRRKSADDILNPTSQQIKKVVPASRNHPNQNGNSSSDMRFSNPHYLTISQAKKAFTTLPDATFKNNALNKSTEEFRIYL